MKTTKAITLPFILLALGCGGDAFISIAAPPDTGSPDADPDSMAISPMMDGGSATEASSQDAQQGADASLDSAADAPKEAADCSFCPNTADNTNCDPNGGWTGNYCPCECFVGLSVQAIAHCGQKGCVCEDSKFPKNPGLSCIKSVP